MNRPTADTQHPRRLERAATTFALGRTTTRVLAVWSGYIATWAVVSGAAPAVVAGWWLAGVCLVHWIGHHLGRPPIGSEPTTSVDETRAAHHLPDGLGEWESEGGATA